MLIDLTLEANVFPYIDWIALDCILYDRLKMNRVCFGRSYRTCCCTSFALVPFLYYCFKLTVLLDFY